MKKNIFTSSALFASSVTLVFMASSIQAETFTVQAESYSSSQGVQLEPTSDVGGGENVGYIQQGDQLTYNINASMTGTYALDLRVAAVASGGNIILNHAQSNDSVSIAVPSTGGWQSWSNVSTVLDLDEGSNELIVTFEGEGFNGYIVNLNWLKFTPQNFEAMIEAEDYNSSNGVQTEATSDANGGENIGYVHEGDTLSYDINVPFNGNYTVDLRVASKNTDNASILLKANNQTHLLEVPYTGGWQSWETHTINVALIEGNNSLDFEFEGDGYIVNLNWLKLSGNLNSNLAGDNICVDLGSHDDCGDWVKDELIHEDNFDNNASLDNWVSELTKPDESTVEVDNGKFNIDVGGGATIWYRPVIEGDFSIEYEVTVINEGGPNDNVKDLNQFWKAVDPENTFLFTRGGDFTEYDDLLLYYVGMGGRQNTTTRFRKYPGDGTRPLLFEYTDQEHLLADNETYHIQILCFGATTQYVVNGEVYFTFEDDDPIPGGNFGFRTVENHETVDNFKVYSLVKKNN